HDRRKLDRAGRTPAGADAVDHFDAAHRADPARSALAAAFRRAELHSKTRHGAHVDGVVEHGDAAVTDQRVGGGIGFVVELDVELVGVDVGAERAADLHRLDRPAGLGAAADVVDQLAQRDAERDFEQAAVLDVARELDRHRAFRALDAERAVLRRAAFGEDVRDGGEREHVVDHRRAPEQALDRRQRRLGADFAALAFEAVEQRGFLTADVGPGADADFAVERGNDRSAKRDRLVQLSDRVRVFAADIDVALGRTDGLAGNRHTFDEGERIAFHDHPVGEGAAVAFVGVADDVLLRARGVGDGLPLDAGREAGAAAAAQAGSGDFLDDLLGADLARAAQADPATGRLVVFEAQRARPAGADKRQALLAGNERVIDNHADRLVRRAVEDGIDVVERGGAEPVAVDFDERLEPLHAPARGALHFVALLRKSLRQRVGAEGTGQGVVGNTDNHRAFSITSTSPLESRRAWSLSPTRAAGPALHRPRQ